MPITVGSQTDVPATGDPIVSPWAQDTATKLVHRFATVAARNAWTTRPTGAMAFTTDDKQLRVWDGATWERIDADADTGYVVGATAGAFTGDILCRRIGPTIFVHINLLKAVAWGPPSTSLEVGTIVAQFRPTVALYSTWAVTSPLNMTGQLVINSAGAVTCNALQMTANASVRGSLTYFAG